MVPHTAFWRIMFIVEYQYNALIQNSAITLQGAIF